MQKKIIKNFLFFLPAILVVLYCGNLAGFAISAINPKMAWQALKNIEIITNLPSSKTDPFADFEFNDTPILPEITDTVTVPDYEYNPLYPIEEMFFTSTQSEIVLKKENAYVKNVTKLPGDTVRSLMLEPLSFTVEKNSSQPQILIMHTHATESYQPEGMLSYDPNYTCRNTDTTQNMVAVGEIMVQTLNSLGYNTIQDRTLHDHPSYNGSYDNSKKSVEEYLKQYPSIKIVLDVHRDAVERDGTRIAPVATINNTKYAQIMIISGADNGYMNMPNYKENLKFASAVQNSLSTLYPGIARPILFDYRNYNQQLTTGSILVEVGSHASTLTQAKNSAKAFAISLANMLDNI